jgi:O-antigen ligase
MSDPYGWKGIFYHKNGLGMFGLFGITLCPAFIRSKIARVPWRTVFGLCCLLVVGSNSMTALLLSAAAVFLWLCVFTYRSRFYAGFIALTISSMIATAVGIWMYLSGNIVALFGLLGKDATLTGRTLLWKLALYAVRQNPWIGYGYRAFWLGKDYGPAAEYMGHYASYLSSSHNGYIDLLLDTGVVGAVLVVLVFAVIFRRLLVNLASSVSRDPYLLWPLVFLVILLLRNFVEADLLVQNNLAWVFVAAFGFYEIRKKTMASVVYKPYFVSPPPELHPAPRTSARRTESGGATTV